MGARKRGAGAKAGDHSPTQNNTGFARHEAARDPEVGLLFDILIGTEEELDAGFEHAYDDGSATRDWLAENRRIAAQTALEILVADDAEGRKLLVGRHGLAVGEGGLRLGVTLDEIAAENHARPEDVKQVSGGRGLRDLFGLPVVMLEYDA